MTQKREIFLSVDVETSGPIPGEYSMLTIGACNVDNPDQVFSCELKPISLNADPKALAVTGLSLERLLVDGLPPGIAMEQFQKWVVETSGNDGTPVFVGLNAPFDWSFVNYYFHKYLETNPFGFTAIDMKAYFMGAVGCSWQETKSSKMTAALKTLSEPNHNALDDARFQAELFALMLAGKGNR